MRLVAALGLSVVGADACGSWPTERFTQFDDDVYCLFVVLSIAVPHAVRTHHFCRLGL